MLIEGGPQNLGSLEDADPAEMLAMLARLLLIAAPVLTAFWFAPLLVAWDGVPALKSVFFSFVASLRNWRAFAAYGLAVAMVGVVIPGLILLVAGSLSPTLLNIFSVALRMLLVFVMAPVLMASVYLSYRDVFHGVDSRSRGPATPPMPEAAIGMLGGTFDPVHSAHLALARTARDTLALEKVLWIPAGQPRHRQPPLAPGANRLAMVQLAIAGDPGFEVDATEVRSAAPSYTVPTLERLRQNYGARRPLVLLLGADAFLGLPSWHRWRELFGLAHLAIATRPGFALDPAAMSAELADAFQSRQNTRIAGPGGTIQPFNLVAGTVSATDTRAMIKAGRDPGDWLPPGILDYIRAHHLYST